jgi:hypothetical protein
VIEKTSSRAVILGTPPAAALRVRKPLLAVRDSAKKPMFECYLCRHRGVRTVYYEDELRAFERHMAEVHDEQDTEAFRQETSMRAKAPGLFDPKVAGDVELLEWTRANREALLSGEKHLNARGRASRNRRRGRSR